ncbi:MAG: ROK family transcriptional regulator [Blautia sp.]|jgi:predicted NBD/HSP70 family sugar kinase
MNGMKKTGKNLTDLLDLNRSQIMYYLAKHPGCSRAELGAATGLTLASITKTVRSLMECGAIYETGFSEGKKGRRSIGLSFNYDKYKILAIRVSWSQLEMQPYDFLGNAYGELIIVPFGNITANNIEHVVEAAAAGIHSFCQQFPEIAAIGLAIPGPCYRDSGSLMLPPYHLDPDKRYYYPLKEKIAAYTQLPIFVEHDVDAGALAYWWFESPNKEDSVIMNIIADDGVGIGLVDKGKVFTGTSNCCCEMGHISIDYNGRTCPSCGGTGCINAYCSTRALEQIAGEYLPRHPESLLRSYPDLSYPNIFEAAKQQDPFASRLVFDCGVHLGQGVLSLLHIFNPDVIIISGAITLAGDLLMNGIQDTFSKNKSCYSVIPKIKLLPNNIRLTLLGAATIAIDRMLKAPTKYLSLSTNN